MLEVLLNGASTPTMLDDAEARHVVHTGQGIWLGEPPRRFGDFSGSPAPVEAKAPPAPPLQPEPVPVASGFPTELAVGLRGVRLLSDRSVRVFGDDETVRSDPRFISMVEGHVLVTRGLAEWYVSNPHNGGAHMNRPEIQGQAAPALVIAQRERAVAEETAAKLAEENARLKTKIAEAQAEKLAEENRQLQTEVIQEGATA